MTTGHVGAQGAARVSTVELFFDLVFVFTITQLTHLVEHAHGPTDMARMALALTVVWWHYAGYVWLTNETGADARMRLVLIAAMAGFLVMAVAIPTLDGAGGLPFGLAYLFVVLLHLGAFLVRGGRRAIRAVLGLAPINLGAAAFVLAAGLVDASWEWLLFVGAVGMFALSTLGRREEGFRVAPAHFAERHGLVLIVALGETVVAIGTGAVDRALDAWTLGAIVLSLAVIGAIWWSYFDRDDARAERVLTEATPVQRSRLALVGYWYTHLVMIAGIVLVATGIKGIVAHPEDVGRGAAWLLAAGLSVYLVGDLLFRRSFGIRPLAGRAIGAVVVLAVGAAGTMAPGILALALAAGMMGVLLVLEERRERA